MTEIARGENRSNPIRRRVVLAVAAACVLSATRSEGFAYDGPVLRGGLWKFERTLETDGKPTDRLQTIGLLIDRQMTRCVNPTRAVQSEFAPFGACSTKDLQKTDDVFQKVSTGAKPIMTKIDVQGDSAYTEIN
jgi:hypothetical protein